MLTFKDVLKNFSGTFKPNILDSIDPRIIIANLCVALLCIIFAYFIYKKTFTGVLYSRSFNITLVMTCLVTSLAVMVISSNLALSLGMVGALSIIRFRSAVKDPKDVGFLFWAVAIGIVSGIGAYPLALISTLFIGLIVFLLSKRITLFNPFVLVLSFMDGKGSSEDLTNKIHDILNGNCFSFKLRSSSYIDNKNEVIYDIKIRNDKIKNVMIQLKEIKEVKKINIFSYEGELED